MQEIYNEIVDMSHGFFRSREITPDTIRAFIAKMVIAYSDQSLDEVKLFNELEAVHAPTIKDDAKVLEDSVGHEEWFNPDTNLPLKGELDWHFWDHYEQYLKIKKGWPKGVVTKLDQFSSLVLSKMEDPGREGSWDRRGMVVGNVQSGKTANYTALITKAIDAGYKLIVVLAGVHNSLRSQTQERINEEVLGYDLDVIQKITGQETRIGVRTMFPSHKPAYTLTSSASDGDFNTASAGKAGVILSNDAPPVVLIVKKWCSVLENIIRWSTTFGQLDTKGRRIVQDIPFLLIDDESDYASVNTKKPKKDEFGNIIKDQDPATTNRLIRKLLQSFSKSIYLGYTATPYANIFIHKDNNHPIYGEDLFPKHFLVSLPQPDNYVGPEEVFGLKDDPDSDYEPVDPLPLVREVDDNESYIPSSIKPADSVEKLPDSLRKAIKSFLLVCSARKLRASGTPHNSMLIHVTRWTKSQGHVKDLVEEELKLIKARVMSQTDKLDDLKSLWEDDFIPTSEEMIQRDFKDAKVQPWNEIKDQLLDVIRNIKLKGINGEIGDTLDYRNAEHKVRERVARGEKVPWQERGVTVIAVGGDKLSRGLTLDGLSVSYYLRSSKMYDTLMQMGRWFGYRDGYNDLCRIYTTRQLSTWYTYIALANKELKAEFEYMHLINEKPESFGLKVRKFPGRLAVTSAGKSRDTKVIRIAFVGEFPKTIVFDPRKSESNRKVLEEMISQIGRDPDVEFVPSKPRFQWKNVEPQIITTFLNKYGSHEDATRLNNPRKIAEYIDKQNRKDELVSWDVVLVSNTEDKKVHYAEIGKYKVGSVRRKPSSSIAPDKIAIGTLTSPADEALDSARFRAEGCSSPGRFG